MTVYTLENIGQKTNKTDITKTKHIYQ